MIFGKTSNQTLKEKKLKYAKASLIKRVYAYLPVQIENGRWVWLDYVYSKTPFGYVNSFCDFYYKPYAQTVYYVTLNLELIDADKRLLKFIELLEKNYEE